MFEPPQTQPEVVMQQAPSLRELALIGGGHTHVQVLRKLIMAPLRGVRVTVIVDRPVSMYSGMVPGFVAGQYRADELAIDVRPLAQRAGARLIVAPVLRVDAAAKRVELRGRPPLRYDLASLNIGSTVAHLDLPGVREHAWPTRPITSFVARLDRWFAQQSPSSEPFPVVIVGGGAAGVELAFCLHERLRALGCERPEVTLVTSGERLLSERSPRLSKLIATEAAARGIALRAGARAASVEADAVVLESGERLPSRLTAWVAGASALPLATASGLPTDARGFVRVRDDLRVVGFDDLFAAGDCAVLESWPDIPKAGVYAVRQGPVLWDNLVATALGEGRELTPYRAQRDYLALLNLGDGRAVGSKWGLHAGGAMAFQWKDQIDRAFMAKFQVLGLDGSELPGFLRGLPAMDDGAMRCGGCAAKVGPDPLHAALDRLPPPAEDATVHLGAAERDDVAEVSHGGRRLVVSTDGMSAMVDDAWWVGRVAAANALSDLYAHRSLPRHATAWVQVPASEDPEELLVHTLSGVRATLDAAGVSLVGGHSSVATELAVGVTVFGDRDGRLMRQAEPGDVLVLSRPLGSGVLLRADRLGRATGPWMQALLEDLARGNGPGAAALRLQEDAVAVTDVTGFGLVGHLWSLLGRGRLSALLHLDALPTYDGVDYLLQHGVRSTFHGQNAALASHVRAGEADPNRLALLYDPQTSGPLLVALPEDDARALVAHLIAGGDDAAAIVGRVDRVAQGERATIRVVS